MNVFDPPIGLAVVAPSGCAPENANLQRGMQLLAKQGFVVHNYYEHQQRHLRFGASDQERVRQMHEAAENPDVQVIMALRGSYGISRILSQLDYDLLASSGKLFVGLSDFTAFNLALLAETGAISFTGPMLCDDFTRDDPSTFTLNNFNTCLRGPEHFIQVREPQGQALHVHGKLWGGNLAMVVHLLGTPYMPDIKGGILFVEDISEHPYRIERMLLQLLHAGVLENQRALILGDFSNYRLAPYDNGYDFARMLAYLRQEIPIPILTGLHYGHIRERLTLPIGAMTELTGDLMGFSLRCLDFPCLSDLSSLG